MLPTVPSLWMLDNHNRFVVQKQFISTVLKLLRKGITRLYHGGEKVDNWANWIMYFLTMPVWL